MTRKMNISESRFTDNHVKYSAASAGPCINANSSKWRKEMSIQITNRFLAVTLLVTAISGFSTIPCLAGGSDCRDNGTVRVCVEWSGGINPVHAVDYQVTFPGGSPNDPLLELITGDDEWTIYSEVMATGAPANLGSLTIDPSSDVEIFKVQIWNPSTPTAGVAHLGSVVLDDTDPFSTWAGHSSIRSGSAIVLGLKRTADADQGQPWKRWRAWRHVARGRCGRSSDDPEGHRRESVLW